MKYLLVFFLFFCQNAFGQASIITGIVINGEDNSKLASASIFINNSSKGTLSDANGSFTLNGITEKNFDLIVSYMGFTTLSIKVTPENIHRFHTIKMFPRKETMDSISIVTPLKDGWKKWGRFFSDMFLGISDLAKHCSIENPKAIKFFLDKNQHRLTAYSNESLIIRNKALGYLVKYQLEEFNYDFKNKMVSYVGYTSFEDLPANRFQKKRWSRERKRVYPGSLMHFMRALYMDSVAEQGYDVRQKIRIYKMDSLFKKIYQPGLMPEVIDGDNHYTAIAGPATTVRPIPDYVDLVNQEVFSIKDAVSFDTVQMQKEFYFDEYLQVKYLHALLKPDYLIANGMSPAWKVVQNSDAILLSKEPLIIEKDGSYFNPLNIITSGYWGWCKMAEMLPSDYETGD